MRFPAVAADAEYAPLSAQPAGGCMCMYLVCRALFFAASHLDLTSWFSTAAQGARVYAIGSICLLSASLFLGGGSVMPERGAMDGEEPC